MTTDDAKMRALIEARLRQAGGDRSPLARWIRLNQDWVERVLQESGAGWSAVAEALVEAGTVPTPDGWSSAIAAERRQARRRLSDAVRQAWRRELARRPSAVPFRPRRAPVPVERGAPVPGPVTAKLCEMASVSGTLQSQWVARGSVLAGSHGVRRSARPTWHVRRGRA
jgi:hypothetical protein